MAFVEDIIFVFGLTGLVYVITDELLLIASDSNRHANTKSVPSRIDLLSQNRHKDPAFNDITGNQKAKVDGIKERECSGVGHNGEANNEVQVGRSRKINVDENFNLSGADELVDQVVDGAADKVFDEMPQRDEVMEDEDNVCFNVGGEVDKNEEDGWLDDWEGIERTELEKQFGAAVAFVNSKSNDDRFLGIEGDVKMKLYGLHNVAIEGICTKPPPMALKVHARAKWRAWKQLEDMNREEAMEKYITLLSKTIPDWMEDGTNASPLLHLHEIL